MEVHDLDNENNNCQIDEIIDAGNEWPYDSLDQVPAKHDPCHWCIGGSTRQVPHGLLHHGVVRSERRGVMRRIRRD